MVGQNGFYLQSLIKTIIIINIDYRLNNNNAIIMIIQTPLIVSLIITIITIIIILHSINSIGHDNKFQLTMSNIFVNIIFT